MGDLIRLSRPDGIAIACRIREGAGPVILFLPGYGSDMTGGKASALDGWAAAQGRACARFDYAGTGESGGDVLAQSFADWLGDALLVLDALVGDVVLVGSSMGGWLALLVALARPARVRALVGVAAAPDFSDWGFDAAQKAAIMRDGRVTEPSDDGAPMVTTRVFWESAQAHLLLDDAIAVDCPVRLIHGGRDTDVPIAIAHRVAAQVRSDDVHVLCVKDGDHRLSRPQDIDLLLRTVGALS